MKRSTTIMLGAAGVLMIAFMWPRAEPKPQAFTSLDDCTGAGVPWSECNQASGEAHGQALAEAPKFQTQGGCEAEFGPNQCRSASWAGASVFVPALAGFLLARNLSGGAPTAQPLYPGRHCPPNVSPQQRPDCPQQQQQASSSGGSSGGSSGARAFSSSRNFTTGRGESVQRTGMGMAATTTAPSSVMSRGGFGSTARGFSSGS
jgi:uncharacterized protein YgiB involved in biofilm formation